MAAGALRELFALFSIGVDSEELEKGAHKLEGFVGRVKKIGEVVAEAFAVKLVKEFFQENIEGAAHIQDLADRLDVSATSIQQFGAVAKSAGLDVDSAAMALGFLQKNLGDARIGGGEAAAAFAKLHVNTKNADGSARNLMDVVGDVSEGFSHLPDQQQRATYAMQLFGRAGKELLPVLSKDKASLQAALKEAEELSGGIGDDFYANAKEAREEGEKFGLAIQAIKNRITVAAMPAIKRLLGIVKRMALGFIDFTKKTNLLKTGLMFLSVVAGYKLITTLGALGKALGLVKATAGETLAALWEFALPVLIVAALYLIFDDLYTLMHGGESVIGDTVDALFGIGSAAVLALYLNAIYEDTIRIFQDFAAIISGVVIPIFVTLWETIKGIAKLLFHVAKLFIFGTNAKDIGKDLEDAGKGIGDAFKAGFHEFDHAASDLTGGKNLKAENLSALLGAGIDPKQLLRAQLAETEPPPPGGPAKPAEGKVPLARPTGRRAPVPFVKPTVVRPGTEGQPAAAAPGGNTVNQTNTFHTTVHTSSDKPKAVGDAVGAGVATTLQKTSNNAIQNVVRQ